MAHKEIATKAEHATINSSTPRIPRTTHLVNAIIRIPVFPATSSTKAWPTWMLLRQRGGSLPDRPYSLRSQSELRLKQMYLN